MLLSTAKSKKFAADAAALCPQVVSLSRAINLSRHYHIAVEIKSLCLTHYACYLTSNTTTVVQQH